MMDAEIKSAAPGLGSWTGSMLFSTGDDDCESIMDGGTLQHKDGCTLVAGGIGGNTAVGEVTYKP